MKNYASIFWTAFLLGCTSFGGPAAHVSYFRKEYVERKQWLDDRSFADLVALSQFLPGPASSQVGIGIGLIRGGLFGSVLSFVGFTLPSVVLLMLFGFWLTSGDVDTSWLHGLKLVAIAIIAQAVVEMWQKLVVKRWQMLIVIGTIVVLLLLSSIYWQVVVLLVAGLIGYFTPFHNQEAAQPMKQVLSKKLGAVFLALFAVGLVVVPIVARVSELEWLVLAEKFYLTGAFVFGGGHVMLPFLESQFVQAGYVSMEQFLAGYGATQAVPGPLFTFASYLGMVIGGVPIAILATVAIFLPGFLLVLGVFPFWMSLSGQPRFRGAMSGINAAVVGLLAATLFSPVITKTVASSLDVLLAGIFFVLLMKWKVKPLVVVTLGFFCGFIFY